jgi:beta-glucosidase
MKYDISNFTLEEKISLLCGKDNWRLETANGKVKEVFLSDGPSGLRKRVADVNSNQIKTIPATAMPTLSTIANTWSEEMAKLDGSTIADDCIENDADVLLAPGVNIKRTPLNGRNFEYFSEDPLLSGVLGKAFIEGVQEKGIGTSLKHFLANNRELDRCFQTSEVDERTLREIYLPAFKKALEAKPAAIMCAYNPINGVFTAENKAILNDILREEMGFDGLIMSDWCAVKNMWRSIKATLDLEMPLRYKAWDEIRYGLEKGYITEADIDARAQKVIDFIYKTQNDKKKTTFTKSERHENAVKIARESMVLLKNDGALPITSGKVAVAGMACLGGGGSAFVKTDYVQKPIHELINEIGNGKVTASVSRMGVVVHYPDCTTNIKQFYELSYNSDYAVLIMGTGQIIEGEGFDRESIKLTEKQEEIILGTAKYCKNVIVVLNSGSPIDVSNWADSVSAIVQGGFAGEAFNEAIVDILLGKFSPCAKLAETYPLSLDDCPASYSGDGFVDRYSDGVYVGYRYYDSFDVDVAYPFGHGLSYANFEYKNLKVEGKGTDYKVSFTIKNTSSVDAHEVCQLYVKDVFASVSRPEKELKGFKKVYLKAGEEKTVEITLDESAFAFYSTIYKKWHVENGDFEILVGSSSKDIRLAEKLKIELCELEQYSY